MRYKYTNLSNNVVRISSRSGSRCSLRPGEFLTDDYYSRYSRDPGSKPTEITPLVRIPIEEESSNYNLPDLPSEFPSYESYISSLDTNPTEDNSCSTSCEAACMSFSESSPSTSDTADSSSSSPTESKHNNIDEKVDSVLAKEVPLSSPTSTSDSNTKDIDDEIYNILIKHKLNSSNYVEDRALYIMVKDNSGLKKYISKKSPYPIFTTRREAKAFK